MSIPKIKVPMFSVVLPTTKKKIMMRSLTTKEYKLLLIAKENKDTEQEFIAIRQVINNAVVDKVDIDTLPMHEIEYMFVKLMIASTAGQKVKLAYRCKNKIKVTDEEGNVADAACNEVNRVSPNLGDAEVVTKGKSECIVEVESEDGQKLSLMFTHPTLKAYMNTNIKNKIDITGGCLTKIVIDESILILGRDYTEVEANELIDDLPESKLTDILQFYADTPQLELKHQFKCRKCGKEHNIHLKGMHDFFA